MCWVPFFKRKIKKMRPTTFCTLFGAYLTSLCLAALVQPTPTLSLINTYLNQNLGISPLPMPDQNGTVLYVMAMTIGIIYFLNGMSASATFARLSILTRLLFAAGATFLIFQKKITDGWYIFVVQDVVTALFSIVLELTYKNPSVGKKKRE